MTLIEEIDKLNQEIFELIQKRNILIEEHKKSASFEEKLDIWSNSDNLKTVEDLFQCRKYPKLYKYIKNSEYERYRTISLFTCFEDEIFSIIENKHTVDKEIREILEEAIENNIGHVIIDW